MSAWAHLFQTQTLAGGWRQLSDRARKALRNMHIHFHPSSSGELPHIASIHYAQVKETGTAYPQNSFILPTSARRNVFQWFALTCPRSGAANRKEEDFQHLTITYYHMYHVQGHDVASAHRASDCTASLKRARKSKLHGDSAATLKYMPSGALYRWAMGIRDVAEYSMLFASLSVTWSMNFPTSLFSPMKRRDFRLSLGGLLF